MTKKELMRLIHHLSPDAVIGFRTNDLDSECPAESFRTGMDLEDGDFAKEEQGFDFIFI